MQNIHLPWIEKYRPSTITELVGNSQSINTIKLFLSKWNPSLSKKSLILVGSPGSGKTSAVYAIAKDENYQVVEINASDTRNKKGIDHKLRNTITTQMSFHKSNNRVILIDEVDGLAGNADRGGLNQLIKMIQKSIYPIICTANDENSDKIKKLNKVARLIKFNRIDEFDIIELLEKIAIKENISISEDILEDIATKSNGDIRAAINDFEVMNYGESNIEVRDKLLTSTDIFNSYFKSKTLNNAKKAFDRSSINHYYTLHFFFDQTFQQCANAHEVYHSYKQIANADLIMTRILKNQNWSPLKYFYEHLITGIFYARKSKLFKKINILLEYPQSSLYIGRGNRILKSKNKIAEKISANLHISKRQFSLVDYKLIAKILNGNNGAEIASQMDLDEDDIKIIAKGYQNSQLVKKFKEKQHEYQKILSTQNEKQYHKFILDPSLQTIKLGSKIEKVGSIKIQDKYEKVETEDNQIPDNDKKKKQTSLSDFF